MVVINDIEDTFWGICLEAGKKYSQTVESAFHISMAAIDPHKCKDTAPVTVYLKRDETEYVLCSLVPGLINQQPLDLYFREGEEVNLLVKEKGTVHLTGYLTNGLDDTHDVEDDSEEGEEEEEEGEDCEDDEEEIMIGRKRKLAQMMPVGKKGKFEMDDDEDMDEDEDEDDEEDEDYVEPLKKKKSKADKKDKEENGKVEKKESPVKSEPDTPATGEKKKKKKKKNKKNKKEEDKKEEGNKKEEEKKKDVKVESSSEKKVKETSAGQTKKKTLKGGLIVEDVKEGHGPEATNGKQLKMFYTGKLQNGKVFDSTKSGTPFSFKLGKKQVIPGWDIGIQGMKVGGKRKLTIPPQMGYGSQAMGKIPANSTLIFEVELKAVN